MPPLNLLACSLQFSSISFQIKAGVGGAKGEAGGPEGEAGGGAEGAVQAGHHRPQGRNGGGEQEELATAATPATRSADGCEAPRLRRDAPTDGSDEGRPKSRL